MALLDDLTKSKDPTYLTLVQANILKVATDIVVEADNVADHVERLKLAKSIISNSDTFTKFIATVLAFQSVSDNNIATALSNNWTKLAKLI